MSYRTVRVALDHGRVSARDGESLPPAGEGLLTILSADNDSVSINPARESTTDAQGIHPDVLAISGLVPPELNTASDRLRHLLDKHR